MLEKMDKAKGGGQRTGNNTLPVLGISKMQSSRWQRAASVPEEKPVTMRYMFLEIGRATIKVTG